MIANVERVQSVCITTTHDTESGALPSDVCVALPSIDRSSHAGADDTLMGLMDEKGDECDGAPHFYFFRLMRDT